MSLTLNDANFAYTLYENSLRAGDRAIRRAK